MAEFEGLLALSRQKIKQADHMLTVTYPLLKEPKLLLSSLDNIFLSVSLAMNAVLQFERSRKKIPVFGDSFANQLSIFATRVAPEHSISKNYVKFISHLKEFVDHHKKSSVEFKRNDAYVMADDDYDMKSLSAEVLKEQLAFAKMFISEMNLLLIHEQEKEMEPAKKVHP